jgi:hypothetical protein
MKPAEVQSLEARLGLEEDEGLDRQSQEARVLRIQLDRLSVPDLLGLVFRSWADFDLYSEVKSLPEPHREEARKFLDAGKVGAVSAQISPAVKNELVNRIVDVTLQFERRARNFKEIHPLALQVILSSGVLNGILVVRSAASCAAAVNRLILNTLETELVVDPDNYKLLEKVTRSTLRVISRNRLLTNAFWTQFFA